MNSREATDDLHLSALVELGLVLFALTILINGLAQLLIVLTTRKGSAAVMTVFATARTENCQQRHADAHRRLRFPDCLHAFPDSGLSGLQRRKVTRLQLLHQTAAFAG